MFINPRVAIQEGWITGIANEEKQVQPNAIDFTLDKLFHINETPFVISEYGKQMRGTAPYHAITDRASELPYWRLKSNSVYDAMSDMYVTVPEGAAAMLIIRSTFNRNGIFLTSGLYDSGFQGHIGFCLHNRSGAEARVFQGTRVGQIIFVESKTALMYSGGWNHEQGTFSQD